ncbi:MAG: NADH-quinone oxidoreductase subunit M [Methylovulum sp.]|nr:NADH-quinone oxidoreductase subunit M [Methylovulum sp.]
MMGMLSLLLWTPALGSLLLVWLPGHKPNLLRLVANGVTTTVLALSVWLVYRYDPQNPALQLSEYFAINPTSGSAYSLGVDGLSMPLLMLCTLLTSVALLASKPTIHIKAYYLCILLLEFGMLGVLLAQDWVLFYIFWEITLFPLFFLISRWGGKRRHAASLSFVFYTLTGSVFMLLSLLALSQYHLEHSGSLMTALGHSAKTMPVQQQVWVLLGFLLGFGIKVPIFPLHGWLPPAHIQAPTAVSILISGVLLKMAAYGLLRVLVILPDAARILRPLLVLLALIGMLYGSLLAWRQSHLKAMTAYLSISQMGMVLLGISSLSQAGIHSALLQMLAHSLTVAALLLLIGQLQQRTHSRHIQDYGDLAQAMPRWSVLMAVSLFAAMSLPGTLGFIAELQTLTAFYQQWGWLWIFVVLNLLITGAYLIRILSLLFISNQPTRPLLADLRPMEMLVAGVLVAAMVALGLQPSPVLALSASTAIHWQHLLNDPSL